MFNLIKMDFYRLLHSKVFRNGVLAATIIAFLGLLLNLGVLEILKLGMQDSTTGAEEMGLIFPIVSWLGGVDFADVIFLGTGTASLFVACMMIASFVGAEQSCGYVKNIAGQLPNRGMTIISKYVVACFIQLFVLLIFTIVSILCTQLFFGSYINAYSIGALVEGLLLRFLLYCAIDAVLLFCCVFAKSHALAMVVGAILGIGVTGLAYLGANALLGMLKINVNISMIMPDGINGLISATSLGTIAVRAIIVSVIFIAVFLSAAVWLFRKRDVK